jgi:adenine-specific DNA-methyltransferase
MTRCNNSTGQFAQFLKLSEKNVDRVIAKRKRSIWREFCTTIDTQSPVGTSEWRAHNRAFTADASRLLSELTNSEQYPAVIYADPPYSKAEYSRYYHVLDALIAYRYPRVFGSGRYAVDRTPAAFGRLKTVEGAIEGFVRRCTALRSVLVLSYPSNGVLHSRQVDLFALLRRHFKSVEVAYREEMNHSTFGGPKVAPKVHAVENVYLCS